MKLIDEEMLADLLKAEACLEILFRNNVDEWDSYEDALRDGVKGDMSYWEYVSQPISEITKDFTTI